MIITFRNSIVLGEWEHNGLFFSNQKIWKRNLIPTSEGLVPTAMVYVRDKVSNPLGGYHCYANFYHQLSFLHEYFPDGIEGDLEFAKEHVDNFLIKMSKLAPFL